MADNNKVLISVIIPVHNTPPEILEESLDSIVKQNFCKYEVLCVDDCSNRLETIAILDKYEKECTNLHVIRLERNSGAANARNAGFRKARGDYVIFLDADDLFGEELLCKTYSEIIKENADICFFEHSILEIKNGNRHISKASRIDFNAVSRNDEMFITSVTASGWNRLCKADYLRDNNILFQNLPSDNDTYFSLMTLLCTDKTAVVNDPSLLFYRYNTDFQISNNMNPLNLYAALKATKKALAERHIDVYDKTIDVYTIAAGIMELCGCKDKKAAKSFYDEFRSYLNETRIIFNDKKINIYSRMWSEQEFDSKWYFMIGDYAQQLNLYADKLLKMLDNVKNIYIWGNGERGKAFGRWAQEHKIPITGICDKKEQNLYDMDSDGIKIVSCDEVKKGYGYIIASNHAIYNELSLELPKESILDLERFCPL